jgi:hypothetical protein
MKLTNKLNQVFSTIKNKETMNNNNGKDFTFTLNRLTTLI